MKKLLSFLVIFALTLTLLTYGIEYVNNRTYNKCMIANQKEYSHHRNCEDVYRLDN